MLAPVTRISSLTATGISATPRARRARVAVYPAGGAPPAVREVMADNDGALVERLFDEVAPAARVPVLALREIIENLVHADFAEAVVSVLDGGHVLRVSDQGPGIPDPARALEPGFTTAGERELRIVRGIGSGLALAAELLERAGGRLELADNLRRGTVVTLVGGRSPGVSAARPAPTPEARLLMALLLELEAATVPDLADELGLELTRCGRELAGLEQFGLVDRTEDGRRSLTRAGRELLTSLF